MSVIDITADITHYERAAQVQAIKELMHRVWLAEGTKTLEQIAVTYITELKA